MELAPTSISCHQDSNIPPSKPKALPNHGREKVTANNGRQ